MSPVARVWARRGAALLAALAVLFLLLPEERAPSTGAWLQRAGLTPKTVRAGRFDVRYVRKGTGKPVILIHGIASSMYSWSGVIEPLSRDFDVIALDLPGYGGSSKPADLAWTDYEPAMLAFMDGLGVARADFVGNSMGGAVSLLMAMKAPERIQKVVVLDAAGFRLQPGERPFMIEVLGSRAATAAVSRLPIRRLLTKITLGQLLHDERALTEERIDEYVAPLLGEGALEATRSLLHSGVAPGFAEGLQRIQAKTLIAWGRYDPWLPLSDADHFAALIPGSRLRVLDTGHMPQEERPDEVARLLAEFLNS